jgi:hypothetical protein
MSHRATVGFSGQLDGEIESRLKYYKEIVGSMEIRSAARVGLSIEAYKKKILNEWWEFGANAVEAKMADRVVSVKCNEKLATGTMVQTVGSFFGPRHFTFSTCPLITSPLGAAKKNEAKNLDPQQERLKDLYFNRLFFNKRDFVNNYIKTGMFK